MQYSTALRGASTKRSPLPDPPWNGLLQFLKVDGELSLKGRFYNVSEIILTCRILHNFCQEAGEEFNDDEVAQRSAEHCSKYSPVHRAAFVVKL